MPTISASTTDQTAEIQAAIDAASGGGKVVLAAGEHPSGALRLRDGIELHLEACAVLRLTADYGALAGNIVSVIAEGSDRGLIVAQGVSGIAITGAGEIAAPGRAYIAGDDPEVGTWVPATLRPRVLVLEDCTDVEISGVRITDSPMWTMHLVNCRDVRVKGVKVENDRRLPNTDGLVIDSCHDVLVEGVDISTADDGVCLKTTRRATGIGTCERVTVRNCRVSSQSCALKIGTESFGDVTDIVFEDCAVLDSNRGLGIFSRDGGAIRNVRFSRISLECHETPDGYWGSGEGLTVTVVDRRAELPAGAVQGLVVEDITGVMEGTLNLVSTAAPIADVTLRRIALRQVAGELGTARRYDLRPTPADLAPAAGAAGRANAWTKGADGVVVGLVDYPGGAMPGVFASRVEGLAMDGVVVQRA
ncbi:glycoside hydrolase family 28 protein [Devosia sp. CN2-171]|uniref:polygalacturonase PglB n=1 Tax=Devosia sp. CN2-171 TaxID=3400909 RepID=UPI003BF83781